MNIYLETFGCTFNQADSQIMAGLLEKQGTKLVSSPVDADLVIINTCYVKQPTEQRVINRINRLQQEFPDKKLVVAGCMVEIDQDKLEDLAPEAGWIGPHKLKSIFEVVKSVMDGKTIRLTGFENLTKVCLPKIRSNQFINIIQICEGCDGACSYCCTRFARGSLQSYPFELIKHEAEKAIGKGCVELQLTAQDTAAYGKDTGNSLSELVNNITGIEGDFRVRVGMMHPKSIICNVDGLIEAFKSDKVYKFLHIPLQSGNDGLLADMNRGHSVHEFKDVITKFRQEFPEISISTDIIVGYPTEDEQAFQDTMQIIKEVKPDFLHISKYHHRPGTPSSLLDKIEHQDMKLRSKRLNELKSSISIEKNQELVGDVLKVLVTGRGSKGGFIGRTNTYKTVVLEKAPLGSFIDAEITGAKGTYLLGETVL